MSLLFCTAGEILFHYLNHPDALNVVSLQNQIVILHHMYQMKLKMSFLNLLSTLSQFILLEKRDNKGTHSLSVQNWLCFRRARRAAWQHSASLCINYVYSQGWSKGTDGKKIGFKEGTDAPASGSSVNLLASGLHARMKSSYPRQSRPSSVLPWLFASCLWEWLIQLITSVYLIPPTGNVFSQGFVCSLSFYGK